MVRAPVDRQGSAEQVHGEARNVRYAPAPRQFAQGLDRLTFHVMRAEHTTGGTSVELRCDRLGELIIRDGDQVTVNGSRSEGGTLLARSVVDHTTHSSLNLDSSRRQANRFRTPLGILAFAGIPAFILAVIALVCARYSDALRLGLPCLAVWAAWYLNRRRMA